MEADEARTLEMLRRYRAAIAGLVERHDGRIVNIWGDAVIAEFAASWRLCNVRSRFSRKFPIRIRIRPTRPRCGFASASISGMSWWMGPTSMATESISRLGCKNLPNPAAS